MNTTDPIADLLTRIRNAIRSRHASVKIPEARLKIEVLRILKEQRLVSGYTLSKDRPGLPGTVTVLLKYDGDGTSAITSLRRISRPGCRVYMKKKNIAPVLNGFGISIVSTSRGLMTGERAVQEGIGGEILCDVY